MYNETTEIIFNPITKTLQTPERTERVSRDEARYLFILQHAPYRLRRTEIADLMTRDPAKPYNPDNVSSLASALSRSKQNDNRNALMRNLVLVERGTHRLINPERMTLDLSLFDMVDMGDYYISLKNRAVLSTDTAVDVMRDIVVSEDNTREIPTTDKEVLSLLMTLRAKKFLVRRLTREVNDFFGTDHLDNWVSYAAKRMALQIPQVQVEGNYIQEYWIDADDIVPLVFKPGVRRIAP